MACHSHGASFFSSENLLSRVPLVWAEPARAVFVIVLAATLLVLSAGASAQDASTGAVRGAVVDPSGGAIPEATVVLLNAATGFRYSMATDSAGRFAFDLLPPGDYSARATAPGMSAQMTPRLQVAVGGLTDLQFKLTLAGAKETVTVSGAPPLVETQPAAVSSWIETRAIDELPLDGRRFTDLALMTPGVTQDPRGMTSGSNGDLAFGGVRGFQSSYLVDGADNNNAFFAEARGRYRAPYQFSNEVCRNSECPLTPTARNWGGPAERWLTW